MDASWCMRRSKDLKSGALLFGDRGVGHDCGQLDERLDTAETLGDLEEPQRAGVVLFTRSR